MAMSFSSSKLQLLLLFSLCLMIPFSISNRHYPLIIKTSVSDIHDLFPKYNLPKGLLPGNVKSYSLSPVDNSFKIELAYQCDVQFKDQLVRYDTTVTGKLDYGRVYDVSGIHAKTFFIWVPVTGMDVDESSNMIAFHVGFLSQELSADDFQSIPSCLNKGFKESLLASA